MMVSDFRHTHLLRGLRPVFIVAMAGLWILSKEEHSFEEARGYRLRTLEKYALLAAGTQDFPLSTFRSRFSPTSQAVGWRRTHDNAPWCSNVAGFIPIYARHHPSGRGNYHMGHRRQSRNQPGTSRREVAITGHCLCRRIP
jgi:hypothetical protein